MGVLPEKVVITEHASVCMWSTSRRCLVGENGIPSGEVVIDEHGNGALTFENNVLVSLQLHLGLDSNEVIKINNSDGIIASKANNGGVYFRYAFKPTKKSKFDETIDN